MRQKSLKRLSVLSLILLAASAVTAAVLQGKSNDLTQHDNSINDCTHISNSGLNPGAGGIQTCLPDDLGDIIFSCRCTIGSRTGGGSEAAGFITAGNTSFSTTGTGHLGDTTSHA